MLYDVESTDDQRATFATALRRQLEGRPRSLFAVQVAEESGETVSENAINLWLKGTSEPTRTKVFAMERVLGLSPGTLSRHLGYVPASARQAEGTLSAIDGDDMLDEVGRRSMRALYRELTRR